jgi:hypothetical protein
LDHYDDVNGEFELDSLCKPYGLCACQVIRDVQLWMHSKHPSDDVLFVFERGDLDQGDLFA